MTALPVPDWAEVPVAGGALRVATWGGSLDDASDPTRPVVLAVHAISHHGRIWALVAQEVLAARPDVVVVAPDLRGRGAGASEGLPGPYGGRAHAADLAAAVDRLGRPVLAVGHSLGAWAVALLASTRPDAVEGLVLVDGGVAIPLPPGIDPPSLVAANVGAALARLETTFPDVASYRAGWDEHPALGPAAGAEPDLLDVLVAEDLVGSPPALRAAPRPDAVRADATEMVADDEVRHAVERTRQPLVLLLAEGGMFGPPPPLVPDDAAEATLVARPPDAGPATWRRVAGTNHYTLVFGRPGAAAVAETVVAALGASHPGRP